MAGKKLSLAIAINLLTENFRKGKNNVVGGLKSMQVRLMTFVAALGFGSIGLSNFVSKMIAVAKETSRVTTALKNVSGGLANYAANQKFVNELAAKYGLEVNSLTGNFAKFTASATAGGMALEKQKKIFESVSRANAAFALTAEESNGVFLALSQMMGKGKITSQELRLQMGEKLPIAIQAMANALGVSIAEMEKMMSSGKLMANDVLPKFADALDKLTPSIDLDNLSTSLNRMSNAFGELTTSLGVESKFKKIVDGVTSIMLAAANNLKTIFQALALGIVFFSVNGIEKVRKRFVEASLEKATNATGLAEKLKATELKATIELNKLEDLRTQHKFASGARQIKLSEQIAAQELKHAKIVTEVSRQQVAVEAAANQKRLGFFANLGKKGVNVAASIGKAFRSMWASFSPAIIITGLVSVFMYFKNLYSETKRIKDIYKDYKDELNKSVKTTEIEQLRTSLKLYNDAKGKLGEQAKIKEELIKLSGVQITSEQDINKVIQERIKLLENQAKVDYLTRKKIETDEKRNALAKEVGDDFKSGVSNLDKNAKWYNPIASIKNLYNLTKLPGMTPSSRAKMDEIKELDRVSADMAKEIESLTSAIITSTSTGGGGQDDKSEELKKLEEKYAQSLAELDVKLKYSMINQEEYNKAKDDLIKYSFIEAKISKDKAVLESKYLKNLEKQLGAPLFDAQQAEISKIQKEHDEAVIKLKNQKDNNAITEKEYNTKLKELIDKTVEQISSMSNLTDAQIDYIKSMQGKSEALAIKQSYTPEIRDTTFDYKKSKTDIMSDELDVAKKNYATLKDLASENLQEFETELTAMMSNVQSMDEALKLAKVREDVKDLNKELSRGTLAAADSIMMGADGIVQSVQRINEAFSNPDASGWEKIMAIWDGMMSTIDSFLQIIDLIEKLSQVTEMLTAAKQAQATAETVMSNQRIVQSGVETANYVANKQTEAKVDMVKTATGSTAAYSAIPWVGVALAAASIAAMFAMIPKFKDGGIVGGGPTSGDQVLARVNAGEMILNKPQQGNLWKMLNSTSRVRGESVEVGGKVRGADIYLALKNYMRSNRKTL